MITEPEYWKSEILNCATSLRDKIEQQRWPRSSVGHLERTVMTACYGARKLHEAGHVDRDQFHAPVSVRVHSSLGSRITSENWRELDLHYDLNNAIQVQRKLSFVCNQLIHSFVFMPILSSASNKGLSGIAFNSDRSSRDSLYYLETWALIDALAQIGDGYVGRPTIFNVGPNGELNLATVQSG